MNRTLCSTLAGLAGAGALTLVHQAARGVTRNAPRMDVLGKRAVRRTREQLGLPRSSSRAVTRQAFAGDIAGNALYYALVGLGARGSVWSRGLGLGLAAGVGAVLLPDRIGLGDPPHAHRRDTQAMTVAWYVIGALVAAAVFALHRDDTDAPAAA